jgi:hypothetical protein
LVEDSLSNGTIQGFLTARDSATLSLALDGTNHVWISNGERLLLVEIEDSCGGIGSIPALKPAISSTNDGSQLETKPVIISSMFESNS